MVDLEFVNKSQFPFTFWCSGFWPNHRFEVKDEAGEEAPLTAFGRGCRVAFSPDGGRDKNAPLIIKPGGRYKEAELDLSKIYRLGVGKYRVRITYDERQGPTPLCVTSNTVAFVVQ